MPQSRSEALRHRMAVVLPAVAIVISVTFGIIHLNDGMYARALLDLTVSVMLMLTMVVHSLTRSVMLAGILGTGSLLGFLVAMGLEGVVQGYFWIYLLPLIAFFLLGTGWGTVMSLVTVGVVSGLVFSIPPTEIHPHIELTVLSSLILVVAFAWMLERLRAVQEEELRQLSAVDDLTGVANRRRFEEVLGAEIRRAARYENALSLLVFDIDHFKEFNDRQGHPGGDRALKKLAALVASEIRDTDTLARLGGDEFVVIAPSGEGGPTNGAQCLANRLCEAVAAHDFGDGARITISMGVADYLRGDELADLYTRADEALYQAKRGGRNRVGAEMEH